MNLSQHATVDQLKEMIAGCNDDDFSHIVWVDTKGEVHVTPLSIDTTPAEWTEVHKEQLRFRMHKIQHGSGFVGPDAANDDRWMTRLFNSLTGLWEKGAEGYRDYL